MSILMREHTFKSWRQWSLIFVSERVGSAVHAACGLAHFGNSSTG
jgi:hypothetical protein